MTTEQKQEQEQQEVQQQQQRHPIIDRLISPAEAVWGIVADRNGKLSIGKLVFYALFYLTSVMVTNTDAILDRYQSISEAAIVKKLLLELEVKRAEQLAESMPVIISSVADYIGADLVAVFEYFPSGKRTYNRMLYYKGTLPKGTSMEDYQSILTETTHPSVIAHTQGISFRPELENGDLLPLAHPFDMYVYGCPIYDRDAHYAGVVAFYWKESPTTWNDNLIYSSCVKAAREIGMYL